MFCWGFCDLAEHWHVKSTMTRAERQSVRGQEWTKNVLVESRSLLSRSASARYLGYHCSPGCPARRTRYTCRYRVPRRTVHSTVGLSKPIRARGGKPAKAQGQTLGEKRFFVELGASLCRCGVAIMSFAVSHVASNVDRVFANRQNFRGFGSGASQGRANPEIGTMHDAGLRAIIARPRPARWNRERGTREAP